MDANGNIHGQVYIKCVDAPISKFEKFLSTSAAVRGLEEKGRIVTKEETYAFWSKWQLCFLRCLCLIYLNCKKGNGTRHFRLMLADSQHKL